MGGVVRDPSPMEGTTPAGGPLADDAQTAFASACSQEGLEGDDRALLWRVYAAQPGGRGSPRERVRRLIVALRQWKLFLRSRRGDESAAASFRDYWKRYVGAFLRGKATPEEVDEVTARFFERVYERVDDTFDWRAPFTAYLRAILVNLWRDRLAERSRSADREVSLGGEVEGRPEPFASEPSPERQAQTNERLEAVRSALSELAPLDRHVIVACLVDGVPGQELAVELGLSRDALYQRLHRAKKRLAVLLQREESPP